MNVQCLNSAPGVKKSELKSCVTARFCSQVGHGQQEEKPNGNMVL